MASLVFFKELPLCHLDLFPDMFHSFATIVICEMFLESALMGSLSFQAPSGLTFTDAKNTCLFYQEKQEGLLPSRCTCICGKTP